MVGHVFQSKILGVGQGILSAILAMLHAPTADGAGPPQINGQPTGRSIGNTPFGVILRSAVQRLGGGLAGIFCRHAGNLGIETHILKLYNLNLLGIPVGIGPVDGQLGALAPLAVPVDGHNLQGHILRPYAPAQGGNVERRAGRLHNQVLLPVVLHLVDLIGGSPSDVVPVDPRLRRIGVGIQDLIQGDPRRAVQRRAGPLRQGQTAQVHLVTAQVGFALHLQADGVENLPGRRRQVHLCGGPVSRAGGQVIRNLLAVLVAARALVAIVGHQLHKALVALVGQAQLHALFHLHQGAVQHDVVGPAGRQVAEELQGVAAVVGVAEVVGAVQLAALGVDDPGPGGQHVLIGLVAPLGIPGQLTRYIVAPAMAGVKIGDKGRVQNGRLVRKEPGHTRPFADTGIRYIHGGIPGIAHRVGIEGLLHLMEILSGGRQAQSGVGAVQGQGQLGQPVLIHQQVVAERRFHAVLLHVQSGKRIKLASADGLHGIDGLLNLS